ncbi:Hypothetical protein SRAE_2000041900 [Strongyloides ratti]|uniref:Uncharacterized protein n=1 Tax=Strongyloides ratti TaxID=34506 RepID=A0A090LCC2_STRRB|nr:Hypothetical protein SRAE_2000041900 [Strongyloides ratti]CEF65743.1 Hypothetical protein SRAE_2000041900 [Strongyloides ratti]
MEIEILNDIFQIPPALFMLDDLDASFSESEGYVSEEVNRNYDDDDDDDDDDSNIDVIDFDSQDTDSGLTYESSFDSSSYGTFSSDMDIGFYFNSSDDDSSLSTGMMRYQDYFYVEDDDFFSFERNSESSVVLDRLDTHSLSNVPTEDEISEEIGMEVNEGLFFSEDGDADDEYEIEEHCVDY